MQLCKGNSRVEPLTLGERGDLERRVSTLRPESIRLMGLIATSTGSTSRVAAAPAAHKILKCHSARLTCSCTLLDSQVSDRYNTHQVAPHSRFRL